jgi:pimeloyl-ACP methyl ester carboxylesterase
MFIQKTGHGSRTVVGLHGWSGDHHTFDPLLSHLPQSYSLYALDLPGCGRSDPPRQWNMKAVAKEVAEALLQMGKKDMILVGSCSGAIQAAFVARELIERSRPEVVGRLVMIDPFAYCPWYFRLFLLPAIGYLIYAAAFANPLGRWLTNLCLEDKRVGETDLTSSFAQVDHRVTWKYLKILRECGRPRQFRGLSLPVDILFGEKTFSAVQRSVEEWKEALPQAKVRELPRVGHLPIQEATTEVAHTVFP